MTKRGSGIAMNGVHFFLLFCLFFFSCSPKKRPLDEGVFQKAEKPYIPLIVLDPGHGGSDDGTKSRKKPYYREKGFNLTLARQVDRYLKELGYRTYMTRTSDLFIPLKERAKIANQLKADLFVSLHFNAAKAPGANGIEVFYPENNQNSYRQDKSKKLASSILDRLLKETNAKSRGVKTGDFLVIRETEMPAVLVESGFLTNDKELKRILQEPDYFPKKIARGIAQGIDAYLR